MMRLRDKRPDLFFPVPLEDQNVFGSDVGDDAGDDGDAIVMQDITRKLSVSDSTYEDDDDDDDDDDAFVGLSTQAVEAVGLLSDDDTDA